MHHSRERCNGVSHATKCHPEPRTMLHDIRVGANMPAGRLFAFSLRPLEVLDAITTHCFLVTPWRIRHRIVLWRLWASR